MYKNKCSIDLLYPLNICFTSYIFTALGKVCTGLFRISDLFPAIILFGRLFLNGGKHGILQFTLFVILFL